jgi:hypothetical protein
MHSVGPQCIKTRNQQQNYSGKHANNWKLNSTLLNDHWVINEIKEESTGFLEVNEKETPEPMGHSKGSTKRKVYSHECVC